MFKVKILLFMAVIIIITVAVFSFVFFEIDFFIRKWHIPFDTPGFFDSRQLAWASESYAQGYDPLVENPVNPRGTRLNYPRIWHLLFALGIDESHTNIIGITVLLFFFVGIGIFWFSREFDSLTYLLLFFVLLSPPVMLGVERSNIELVLFFILSLALTINYRSTLIALFPFLFAAILKLYPVFSLTYLLKENKRTFWILLLAGSGIFLLYAALSLGDFIKIFQTTPKGVSSSFGRNIWWMALGHWRFYNLSLSDNLVSLLRTFSSIMAFTSVAVTLYFGMNKRNTVLQGHSQYIDAFRVGASIYIFCFLLMNTADYRMVFLVFTIPQLSTWIRYSDKSISLVPRITITAMMISIWSNVIMRFLGRKITFPIEELCNWIMLTGLLFLFFSSLPDWISDYLRRPISFTKTSGNQYTSK
jgi:hypothetical protein